MSNSALRLLAGAGAKDSPVYVDDVFSTFLYDGNNGSLSIDNGLDLSGEGGLVWIKGRGFSSGSWSIPHGLYDTERGANKLISSSSDATQSTVTTGVDSFDSDGFSLNTSNTVSNSSVVDGGYVSWSFRKAPGFFDIVTYTGNGSARTISHNLGSTPGMIIVKNLDQAYHWTVYHRSMGGYNYYNHLNQLYTFNNADIWNAAPTSTVFSVGGSSNTNHNGDSYVAYLFAHDAQDFGTDSDEAIIKCGSYTGNGSSTGPTVDLGFEPQFILTKSIGSGDAWGLFDSMRGLATGYGSTGGNDIYLQANANDQEYDNSNWIDLTSTGFKLTNSHDFVNGNNYTYIYMAIRRPHKPASEFAATKLFNIDLGANTSPGFDTGFPVDMGIFRIYGSTSDFDVMSRITGLRRLDFTTGTEANKGAAARMDHMDGWSYNVNSYIGWAWRRAPGFFDVVAYTGNGSAGNTINHNLGVAPELLIVKRRNSSRSWYVYAASEGNNKYTSLEDGVQFYSSSVPWNDTTPTASVFTVGSNDLNNGNGDSYTAFLFASVTGISKVGSYTGTGNDLNVDCGFSAGSRFVLIHRTDADGGWYVYDSVQGIVAGNDPYLLFDSDAAQVTNTDYIDPLSSGFTVTSSAPDALNASGGTYLFYAIA